VKKASTTPAGAVSQRGGTRKLEDERFVGVHERDDALGADAEFLRERRVRHVKSLSRGSVSSP
jgi:hypothetical protein